MSNLKYPDSLEKICSGNTDEPIKIKMQNNTNLNKYLTIYKDMTQYYMNSISNMIKILETDILNISYNDEGKVETVKIRIKNNDDLSRVEKLVR